MFASLNSRAQTHGGIRAPEVTCITSPICWAATAAHAPHGSPSFPISQCRRTSRGRELMGRLLILIFPKVRNAPLLARFGTGIHSPGRPAVSGPFAVGLDADRSVCAWKASPPSSSSSLSLCLSANATGFCTAVSQHARLTLANSALALASPGPPWPRTVTRAQLFFTSTILKSEPGSRAVSARGPGRASPIAC